MTFRASIRPKYYLALWAGFMEYRNELTEGEKRVAKVFFKALAALDKEDVSLLAEKYLKGEHKTQYVPEHDGYMGRLPITDSVLADCKSINVKEYREARIRAENRLRIQLKHYADEIEANVRQELPSYVLRMNSLYLKRYEIGMFDQVKEEIIFTQDKSQAKVFTNESEEGRGLAIGFNLTKEEPETSSFYLDVRV